MTPKDLKKCADQVFTDHPKTEAVVVASDGTCFLPSARNLAKDYAHRNGLTLQELKRDEPAADPAAEDAPHVIAEMTVSAIKEWAAGITEAEVLEAAIDKSPSKGGVEAIKNRIDELKAQDQ